MPAPPSGGFESRDGSVWTLKTAHCGPPQSPVTTLLVEGDWVLVDCCLIFDDDEDGDIDDEDDDDGGDAEDDDDGGDVEDDDDVDNDDGTDFLGEIEVFNGDLLFRWFEQLAVDAVVFVT